MTATPVRLNYLYDSLLGPIAKSVNSELLITPITLGAFQVLVISPVPDDLHKAHTLTFTLSSQHHLTGAVVHT